jgi:outer membrane lipoprotein-sorting protein
MSFFKPEFTDQKSFIRVDSCSFAVIFSLLFLMSTPAFAEPVADLMERLSNEFSGIRTVQARFIETKQIRILEQEMELTGSLAVEKPERLAWRVEKPLACTIIIANGKVSQWDEDSGKIQSFSSRSNPVFAMVLDQMQNWFSGDFISLLADYDVSVKQQNPLMLTFVPLSDSPNAQAIRQVCVTIRDDLRYVQAISIEDTSGDTTTITFIDTRLNQPVPAETWRISRDDG